MTNKLILKEQDWFEALIEELEAIIVETRFNSITELIKGKYLIGVAILEKRGEFERFGYGENSVNILSKFLKTSACNLYDCLKFAEAFKTWEEAENELPDGKAISWNKVIKFVLKGKEIPKEIEQTKPRQKKISKDEVINILCKCCKKKSIGDVLKDKESCQEVLNDFLKELKDK